MSPTIALYWALAATGGVAAGLLGKMVHTSGRIKGMEDKVENLGNLGEVQRLVNSELSRKS